VPYNSIYGIPAFHHGVLPGPREEFRRNLRAKAEDKYVEHLHMQFNPKIFYPPKRRDSLDKATQPRTGVQQNQLKASPLDPADHCALLFVLVPARQRRSRGPSIRSWQAIYIFLCMRTTFLSTNFRYGEDDSHWFQRSCDLKRSQLLSSSIVGGWFFLG